MNGRLPQVRPRYIAEMIKTALTRYRGLNSLRPTCVTFVGCRYNSTTPTGSSATQQLLTLRELDRLVTSIASSASSSSSHPSPLAMRSNNIPWLTPRSPDLASSKEPKHQSVELSDEEKVELDRPRHMSESYTSFHLPLASDKELFERYVNTSGGFRMGKLLEHLDSLAGAVAYRHCLPKPTTDSSSNATEAFHHASARAGLYLATASADRLDMFGILDRNTPRDLRFSGFVTYTGSSSMEVVVKMESLEPTSKGWTTMMLGRFAMVCRDSRTQKARKVPRLIVETEEEKALWMIGEDHTKKQKQITQLALDKVPPSSEEAKSLHELMLRVKTGDLAPGNKVVHMKDTEIESVQLMFPQDRNLHGKVFGGILMRLAFELCFTNAAIFASAPMRFLSLDQITFRLPVPIGAVLRLSSKVVYTTDDSSNNDGGAKVHIMVRAEVEEIETGLRRETNTFLFTMMKETKGSLGKTVIPTSYAEAMHYLEGRRRLELGEGMRRLYQDSN